MPARARCVLAHRFGHSFPPLRMRRIALLLSTCLLLAGCSALPDISHQPRYHNPFPQLSRVAVLPFYNQSAEPTVDGDAVALAYYNELQAIRGFEVVPVGVTKLLLINNRLEPSSPEEFQDLARRMDVDAVVVGSITEFSSYYPPHGIVGAMVRCQSELSSDSTRLWIAVGNGRRRIHPGGSGL